MALARTDLTPVYQVGAATTVGVVTVGSGQTVFIKSVLIHNLNLSTDQNVKVHVVPNSSGSAGSSSSITQIARVGVATADTFFFEPAYPIVLSNNGDWIDVSTSHEYIVVNIGDMLQECSDGYYPSTTHRVIYPLIQNTSRFSLPFFVHARDEVILSKNYR